MTSPSVFISYSHDSPEYKDRILALSNRLCDEGVDCSIDQYVQSPEEGWPLWCERQVAQASFVLVACTKTYLQRFKGEEVHSKGLGGTWEGHIITQELYNAQGRNTKYIPITLHREASGFIPLPLQSATRYLLDEDYESLYRHLTAQPAVLKPVLGSVIPKAPRLPPKPRLELKQGSEPIWQMRHRKNVFFTGRDQILADLRKALENRGTAALSGLGGVGKTQTAMEYAYRYRHLYSAVFWVDAELRETLLAGFVAMAAVLNLSSAQAQNQERAVVEVHRWLEVNSGWLLILDNADELPMVQEFLPNQAKGHVLVTTRAHAAAALAEGIPVKAMLPEEGALLLLRRAGVLAKEKSFADADHADRRSALDLSKELGGLPLALDQAGALIEESRLSISEYAALYASQKAALLADRGSLGKHPSVTVTFSLAFQKVASNSAAAADLIRLCAFLAPDAIPEEIFTTGDGSILGENLAAAATDKLTFVRFIREASRFSLLERDATNQTLNIHRLVQVVIQAGMSEVDRRMWAERAVRAVNEAFPNVEYANWKLCQRLIGHAQTCSSLIREWNFTFLEAAKLLNLAAFYLDDRALFAEAEPLYRDSLTIYEKVQGPEHIDVAISFNNLGVLYRKQGRYADAEPLYKRSLAIREKVREPDHPDVAAALNNLALLFDSQGKYSEAEPLYQRSLAIWEKALGSDHPNVSTSLHNLASLYDNQGNYTEAEKLFTRALAIREKALGTDHPDVATTLNNFGVLYNDCKRFAEAEPLYERALGIRQKTLGPDHPDVAQSLRNLAVLYDNQGRHSEAQPLYQRADAVDQKRAP